MLALTVKKEKEQRQECTKILRSEAWHTRFEKGADAKVADS